MFRKAENPNLALDADQLKIAQSAVGGCEQCDPRADTPFYWVLDATVGSPGSTYTIPGPVDCPVCSAPILKDTLVRWS